MPGSNKEWYSGLSPFGLGNRWKRFKTHTHLRSPHDTHTARKYQITHNIRLVLININHANAPFPLCPDPALLDLTIVSMRSAAGIRFIVNSLAPSAHSLKGQTSIKPQSGTNNRSAPTETDENQHLMRSLWLWLLPVQDKTPEAWHKWPLSEVLFGVSLQLRATVVQTFI